MEARYLQVELESALPGQHIFLDSDDLHDLRLLKQAVIDSDVLVLLQSARVLERPWCLIELATALDNGIPIVGVSLTSGRSPYNFEDAAEFLKTLETALGQRNPGAGALLVENDIELSDLAWKLSVTLPAIISISFNPSASKNVLSATIADILEGMRKAKPIKMMPKAEWLKTNTRQKSHSVQPAAPARAMIPLEVPEPPTALQIRLELLSALKEKVLSFTEPTTALVGATRKQRAGTMSAHGMGGVGKTCIAAQLMLDEEIGSSFEKLLWLSVSQDPDLMHLLDRLHFQLTTTKLPASAETTLEAAQMLHEAAKGKRALLVLDDVWDSKHAEILNCVDVEVGSACLITTRIRGMAETEVRCGLLSVEESISLLLTSAGLTHLIDNPPAAAFEAVECCGRLPLALPIAGGCIRELEGLWEEELVPMLEKELEEELSIEERIVNASFRCVDQSQRVGVEALFTCFGCFAEDAVVPAPVIDMLAPMVSGRVETSSTARPLHKVRKWLASLLRASLLNRSGDGGVCVHDLVRDVMVARAEAAPGGMAALQREVLTLYLAACDGSATAALKPFIVQSIRHHVAHAQQADVSLGEDELLMSFLGHTDSMVVAQAAVGFGVERLRAEIASLEAAGRWWEVALLLYAASLTQENLLDRGADSVASWNAIKKCEEARQSMSLEARVISQLIPSGYGEYTVGTPAHRAAVDRLAVISAEAAQETAPSKSMQRMEAEGAMGLGKLMLSTETQGTTGYAPITRDSLMKMYELQSQGARHAAAAMAAAPNEDLEANCSAYVTFMLTNNQRLHALPEFDLSEGLGALLGARGAILKRTIEQYDFPSTHSGARSLLAKMDFHLMGYEVLFMLLFFGNVGVVRLGVRKFLYAHRKILEAVEQGRSKAEEYAYEAAFGVWTLGSCLLLLGERDSLCEYLANSLAGAATRDESILTGTKAFWTAFGAWKTEDGHCHSTPQTWLLGMRGLHALTGEGEDTASLREWIPSPAELLRIGEYEADWRCQCGGGFNPALLFAQLYGERLNEWDKTIQVVEGMLRIEEFNPLLRTGCFQLLGRAHAARGSMQQACEAAERAIAEAAGARYVWLEMLALRDLMKWCETIEGKEEVRTRLVSVVGRVDASTEELIGVLGEGVL